MKLIAIILGTRPEIIKLAPVIQALKDSGSFSPLVIFTGQHREMGYQAFKPFSITPDIDLQLMEDNQTPNSFLAKLLPALESVLKEKKPVGVIVQGDTTTALGGALCAFHLQIPVAHVEAGLRTHRLDSPFPEEMNRTVVSRIADLHFAPTKKAAANLANEGVTRHVHTVGNTVVDALLWTKSQLDAGALSIDEQVIRLGLETKRFVFVTGHRRENFDLPLRNLCAVLLQLTETFSALEIVYPVHLNPNVCQLVQRELRQKERIYLLAPVDHPTAVHLMKHAALIISDSGGIQEEAPSLQTMVLVTRATTEREEALEAGVAKLCPLERPAALYQTAVTLLLTKKSLTGSNINPFGDGTASKQILSILKKAWN